MKVKNLALALGLLFGLSAWAQFPTDCVLVVAPTSGGSYVNVSSGCTNVQTATVSTTPLTVNNSIRALIVNFGLTIAGSPSAMSIPVQGCKTGGVCDAAAATYTSTSTGNQAVTFTAVYDYFKLTPTWTGAGVSVVISTTAAH